MRNTTARRPGTPVFDVAAMLLCASGALFAFVVTGSLLPPTNLASIHLPTRVTPSEVLAVERAWIDDAAPARWLPSPPPPLPCFEGLSSPVSRSIREIAAAVSSARGDREAGQALERLGRRNQRDWVIPLATAHLLVANERKQEAADRLDAFLQAPGTKKELGSIKAAVSQGRRFDGPREEAVKGLIQCLHFQGSLRLELGQTGRNLYSTLRHAVACSRLLGMRARPLQATMDAAEVEDLLPAPGCPRSGGAMLSSDLVNNLIVGYLSGMEFPSTVEARAKEFYRSYSDQSDLNPVLAALDAAKSRADGDDRRRLGWLWALSNAETFLRNNPAPRNVRLCFNLGLLLDSAVADCPEAARAALERRRDGLLRTFRSSSGVLLARETEIAADGLDRLALSAVWLTGAAVDRPLHGKRGAVRDALLATVPLRRDMARWLPAGVHPAAEERIRSALGERADAWLSAARKDLAGAVAAEALEASPPVRLVALETARAILRMSDPDPPAVRKLADSVDWGTRLSAIGRRWGPAGAAVAACLVLARVCWWMRRQLRRHHAVFTSFYRLEAESLRRERNR